MIDIRDVAGTLIVSVPVTEASEHVSELMVSDYVLVSYLSLTGTTLPAGAYVVFDGKTYRLLKPYKPKRVNEAEYLYEPQFHAKVMSWSVRPFFFLQETEDVITGRETDWTLTDTLPNFLEAIVASLLDEFGETYTYSYDASLTGNKTLSFQATSIFDALNELATAWETEWYLNGTVITFGKCAFGTPITLTVGIDVSVPDITPPNDGYYTRFYAFGSTRNINQDYTAGTTTNHVVQKRLTLPVLTCPLGYKDIQAGLDPTQIFTKVLVFDDIYPSSTLAISAVRAVLKYAYDGDGNLIQIGTDEFGDPIYDRYSIFYFKIAGFTFTEDMIIAGLTLSAHFESGNLLGREFELAYHSTTQEYEIIFDESTGFIIPNEVIIPSDGDSVVLFNILMPQAYVMAAEEALEDAVDAEMALQGSDLNTYRVNSFPVRFTTEAISLSVGSNVNFVNGADTLSTRVLSITEKLDFPAQKVIQIGEKKTYRVTQQLKEAVTNINRNVDVISALNDLSTSIQNAYGRTQKQIAEALAQWNYMWYFDKTADTTPDKTDYSVWKVRSNFDLFINGEIQATEEITAWIAGAVQNEVLANLTVSAPLRKPSASTIVLDYDASQFELVTGVLTIQDDILTPAAHAHVIADVTGLQTALNAKLDASLKGAVSGLAELDATGKVPAAQLPEAASSLELGETSATAYRGDRGKIAYDHSQVTSSNPHATTFAQLVGLPTTLAGYGITDQVSLVGHTHPGYISASGTPLDNQLAVFTGEATAEGSAALTFDGTTFYINGDINIANGKYYRVGTNMAIMQDGTMFKFGWLGLGTSTRPYFATISNGIAGIYTANTQRLAVTLTGEVQVLNSLQANTINEYTASAGVTVDGVLIKDSQIGIAYLDNSIFEYVPNSGNPYLRLKLPVACDYEIQAWSDFSQFPSTIWESLPAPSTTVRGGILLGGGSTRFLREDGTWQTVSGSGGGTVTSVGMTVPTGFAVSGSPITASGTLALSFASGYALPTSAQQTNWNTAYTERNRWDGGSTGLTASTGRTSLGLGGAAILSVGTAAGTVAAGDHTHSTYALLTHTHSGYAPLNTTMNARTAAYTLVSVDNNKVIECSGTFTVTLPNSMATGYQVTIVNVGTGVITIAASTTIYSKSANRKLASQWIGATAYHRGSNVWVLMGDLTA